MTYFMIYVAVLLLVSFIDVLLFARYWEPKKDLANVRLLFNI